MLITSILAVTFIVTVGGIILILRESMRIARIGREIEDTEDTIKGYHRWLDANQLMYDYEKEVFGWWGGDKAKADAMTASEIQEKWEEHQKKLRELGFL